jgi:RNA polymerase sigma-70 factor (ECF subfamily)
MPQTDRFIASQTRPGRLEDDILKQHLEAIAAGDKRAFKAFYEVTSGPCYGIVLRLLQDPDAAQDVLQKAYVSIWKNAGKYDAAKGKAFTWIVVIMRNRALDALRARARAPETELIEETVIDPTQKAEARAESFLLSRHLQKAFDRLPDHVSVAVQMNVVEGYSSREIGELFDVSRNTVKTWIRRGLASLRHDLPMSSYSAAL